MAYYDSIKLEKGLYCGGSLTGALEKEDPTQQYKGTSLEGLDAFERQLKRFGIRVGGAGSDAVEKFFQTSDSAVLFPEYVARAVKQGMEQADVLPRITAATTVIDTADYRTISSEPSESAKELKSVAEGAFIPETRINVKSNLVTLRKRGRMLVASYEAVRRQRLDLFTVTLRQIGAYIARSQLKDAVDVLVNGDGNNNAAPVTNTAAAGTLAYTDLTAFWNSFDPCEFNTMLVSPDIMQKMLEMGEMRDAAAGLGFHATGKMITPLGADLIKAGCVESATLIGIDRSCALETVRCGGIVTEYDKLIDRQLERAAITCTAGFAKIHSPAVKVLRA